jgi:hypothetical protein
MENYMVRPIKQEPVGPSEQTKGKTSPKEVSPSLKCNKEITQKFVDGRGRSALGAGALPTFSDQAPTPVSSRVSKVVVPSLKKPHSN